MRMMNNFTGDFKSSNDDYGNGGHSFPSGEYKCRNVGDDDFPPSEDFQGTDEDDEDFPPSEDFKGSNEDDDPQRSIVLCLQEGTPS